MLARQGYVHYWKGNADVLSSFVNNLHNKVVQFFFGAEENVSFDVFVSSVPKKNRLVNAAATYIFYVWVMHQGFNFSIAYNVSF